jgi:2-keto-4-pentenoate hydratase
MTSEQIAMAARLLVEARRNGTQMDDLPEGLRPADLEEAYRLHHAVADGLGPTGGWKTAPAKDGVPFNWGRIPQDAVHPDRARLAHADYKAPAAELEIGLRLERDLPPRDRPYNAEEVAAAIGAAHAILEILSARFIDKTRVAPLTLLADGLSNGAMVLGGGNPDWRAADFAGAGLVLDIGGERWRASDTPGTAPVLAALTDLANGAMPVGGLKAGQVVITGARLGPTAIPAGSTVRGEISGIGRVEAHLA